MLESARVRRQAFSVDSGAHSVRRAVSRRVGHATGRAAFAADRRGSWHNTWTRRNYRHHLLIGGRSFRLVCRPALRPSRAEKDFNLRSCFVQYYFISYISRFHLQRVSDSADNDGIGGRNPFHLCPLFRRRSLPLRATRPGHGHHFDGILCRICRWRPRWSAGGSPPGLALGIRVPFGCSSRDISGGISITTRPDAFCTPPVRYLLG